MNITKHPITKTFGLEFRGLDIAQGLDQETMVMLSDAFISHKLLLFRDQNLTPEQYAAFGRDWSGDTRIDGFEEMTVPGYRDVNIVGNVGEYIKMKVTEMALHFGIPTVRQSPMLTLQRSCTAFMR